MRSGAFRMNWWRIAACASTASRREIRDRDRTCVITVSAPSAALRGSQIAQGADGLLVRSLMPYRSIAVELLLQARSSSR
jgi:hypothetical protein